MKSWRLALLAVLFLTAVSTGRLAAQAPGTIVGVVVEAQSGQPLVATHVELVEAHRSETSGPDGSFSFAAVPAGSHTLAVQRIGYAPLQVIVQVDEGRATEVRIEMQVAAVEFEEIIVTGTITERAGQDVLSPTSVVSGADLERKLEATVAATLAAEPGVAVTGLGPATARPVIRGLGGDRIVMLEDGVRSGDMSSVSADHAVAIDPLTAQRFEVVRGPMSLLYGSSALGGVVNVVREEVPRTVPDHFHGAIVAQGETVSTGGTIGGFAVVPVDGWAARLEGSVRGSGDVDTPAGRLDNTDARAWNLAAGFGRQLGNVHVGGSYRFYDSRYGIPDAEHDEHEEEVPGGEEEGHAHQVHVEMRRHSARGELDAHDVAFFDEVRVTGGFTDYEHREIEADGEVGTAFLQQVVSLNVLARHGAQGPVATGALDFSAQYRDIETGGELSTPSTRDYSAAVFLFEELGTGPLRLQAGARYDLAHYEPQDSATIDLGGIPVPVYDRTFGSVSGSIGLLYALSDPVRIGVSAARAYRTPDFNELYTNGPHLAANSFDVGDPSLVAETGFGLDAFVRYSGSRLRAEVAAFRNQLDGYVFPSSRGRTVTAGEQGLPLFQYTNEDARFVGVEGSVDWSMTERLIVEATGSIVQAEFTSERAPIPVFADGETVMVPASKHPPFIPPANGRLALRYETADWFAGAAGRFAAEQDRTGDFESPTAAYAVADLTGGIRFLRGGRLHTLTLRVDNLLDTEYRDHLSRIKEIMPQPGRNVSLLYRLTF